MRFLTHQFAHLETLERARRWLVLAGIDPNRVEAHTHGNLRLTVLVEGGESVEVQHVIDVAESSDSDGRPSFWELASPRSVVPQSGAALTSAGIATHSRSFVIGWHPLDADRDQAQTGTAAQF
jgi:hypothetical protein